MSCESLTIWLAVAVGGAFGALLRAGLFRLVERLRPASRERGALAFGPARATLLANTLGCGLLGWLAAGPMAVSEPAAAWRAFAMVGLCGALTTFSTLCADAIGFFERRPSARAILYLAATLVLGVAAWCLGHAFAR